MGIEIAAICRTKTFFNEDLIFQPVHGKLSPVLFL